MIRKCETCEFISTAGYGRGNRHVPIGECRFNPPVSYPTHVLSDQIDPDVATVTAFPVVHLNHWCSMWKKTDKKRKVKF